jgi:hypothetical protein
MSYANVTFKVLKPKKLVKFDPNNIEHIKIFQHFLVKNNWQNGCPFQLEQPYLDTPSMIKDKITKNYIFNAV